MGKNNATAKEDVCALQWPWHLR